MRVEFLEPSQYDLWNDFVDCSPQGDVFCYSWWLDAITRSDFRILVVKEKEKIKAGMPLAYDSQKKINLPPLTRTLGVLYCDDKYLSQQKQSSVQRKWLSAMLENIQPDQFVQTCMHHSFTDWLPFRWSGFGQTTRYTYLLSFRGKTIGDLWNDLDNLRKRTIKRAEQNSINIGISEDFNLVYKFASLSYKRQGLDFRIPYADLKNLDDAIAKRGNRVIFIAQDDHKIHAVLYAAFNNRSAYYLLSGSDPDLRNLGGHTLVMWEAIKFFHDKVEYFNFGGSDIESIESHIKGYGGTLTPYFHIFNEDNLQAQQKFMFHVRKLGYHLKSLFVIGLNKVTRIHAGN